ncbi:hypothetical protein J7K76_04540, partial [Candidatus Bipolaricaulota bacterium]|nr:hypothetical protein [Candidatus Bipolaricaulota bacterium]
HPLYPAKHNLIPWTIRDEKAVERAAGLFRSSVFSEAASQGRAAEAIIPSFAGDGLTVVP